MILNSSIDCNNLEIQSSLLFLKMIEYNQAKQESANENEEGKQVMADKLVEGIWDCPYCDAKGIGGLRKYCPNCGHPQDKGTKFRLGEEKRYLTDEETESVGKGPDWGCEYCGSMNKASFKFCANCGAPKEADTKDYFQLREEESKKEQKAKEEQKVKAEQEAKSEKRSKRTKKRFFLLAALFALILLGIQMCSPKAYTGTIDARTWERNIEIEKLTTVEESDWSVPSGGRQLYTKREIRTYKQVFDHYETKTRSVPYQVEDGYDTSYSDNGDGTFTEHKTPKYRTEYRTEEYEEAVYRDEPVYDTKYYYEIDKWKHSRDVSSKGSDEEPYWGEVKLDEKEREGKKTETYVLTIVANKGKKSKEYTYETDLDTWKSYKKGQKVEITVSLGSIDEIK